MTKLERKELLDEISELDLRSRDESKDSWKKQLKNLLKENNLENFYYGLSQSLLTDGKDIKENDFLNFFASLPDDIDKNIPVTSLKLISDLMDTNGINVYRDNWLFDKKLYNETDAESLNYKIKAIIFLKNKHNLAKYGDPNTVPKLIDERGNLKTAFTAIEIKNLLSQWQKETSDKIIKDENITGENLLKSILNIKDKDEIKDENLLNYIKNLGSLKQILNDKSDYYISGIVLDPLRKFLSSHTYEDSFLSIKKLNKNISNLVINLFNSIS